MFAEVPEIYMTSRLVNILIILMKDVLVKRTANQCECCPALRPLLTPRPPEWPSGQRSAPKVNHLRPLHWTESFPWIRRWPERLWESWKRPLEMRLVFPEKTFDSLCWIWTNRPCSSQRTKAAGDSPCAAIERSL